MTCPLYTCAVAYTGLDSRQVTFYKVEKHGHFYLVGFLPEVCAHYVRGGAIIVQKKNGKKCIFCTENNDLAREKIIKAGNDTRGKGLTSVVCFFLGGGGSVKLE